jgi:hypothetical protein
MDDFKLSPALQKIIDIAALNVVTTMCHDKDAADKTKKLLTVFIKHGVELTKAMKIMDEIAGVFNESEVGE